MKLPFVLLALLAAAVESSAQTPTRTPVRATKQQAPVVATTERLQISLGESLHQDPVLLLSLGNVAVGQTVNVTLLVNRVIS